MLSAKDWHWAQRSLPIACVDFIPVQFGPDSVIKQVGLIQRLAPVDPAWCLIGGRILLGESIGQAGQRILTEAGGPEVFIETADWNHPDYVAEYLLDNSSGLFDPRNKPFLTQCSAGVGAEGRMTPPRCLLERIARSTLTSRDWRFMVIS